MGRPQRHDVDYFPFIVKDGRTLFILEGRYGCKGTGFFTNVLRFLASTPDHWFSLEKETDRMMFFTKVHCDEESGMDMIEIMVKTGKLDQDLWRKKHILTSEDFLESIQDAYRKRENKCITLEEIRKINTVKKAFPAEETGKTPEDTAGKGVTGGSYPQSKVKESKKEYSAEFNEFWSLFKWPSKGSKKAAFDEWGKSKNDLPSLNELSQIIKKQIAYKIQMEKAGKFIPEFPHVERYIKKRRWEDEVFETFGNFGTCSRCGRTNRDLNEEGVCLRGCDK